MGRNCKVLYTMPTQRSKKLKSRAAPAIWIHDDPANPAWRAGYGMHGGAIERIDFDDLIGSIASGCQTYKVSGIALPARRLLALVGHLRPFPAAFDPVI